MNIVFTGTFKVNGIHFERKHLIKLAEEAGHYVEKSVNSFTTDVLVCGDGEVQYEASTKLKKAKKHKIKTIHPKEFLKLVGML